MDKLTIFSGNANPKLAQDICKCLKIKLGDALVSNFSDSEIRVKINENVRGKDVFLIQSTCPPVNENIMELLIMLDALKRASAQRITAVMPYYGYARQDRKDQPRVPITAKLIADLISISGADRVLTMDLHAGQIQGFFNIPLDHLYAVNVFVEYLSGLNLKNPVIVSPDVGGIKMARAYAKRLSAGLAIVDKRRINPDETEVMNLLGEVKDKDVVIVDDIIATGSSVIEAANFLNKMGAREVYVTISHGVLSGDAIERVDKSNIKQLCISDSIPIASSAEHRPKIKVLSIAGLMAEAIKRIHREESVSSLFD